MPQLKSTIVVNTTSAQFLDSNPGRLWIFGQSLGPGRVTVKQDQPNKDIDDGSQTIFPYGTFVDSGDGLHKGKWYAIADQDGTKVLLTEAIA